RGWLTFVVIAGAVTPAVVLSAIMGINLFSKRAEAAAGPASALTIEVVGHQWWWEIRYPERDVITANELHIPVGQPVNLRLNAADVIHSFWVPQLEGKRDLIPGRTNALTIEASWPGIFRGQCAEFCGVQHANMAFLVKAEPPATFNDWIEGQQQAAPEPRTA